MTRARTSLGQIYWPLLRIGVIRPRPPPIISPIFIRNYTRNTIHQTEYRHWTTTGQIDDIAITHELDDENIAETVHKIQFDDFCDALVRYTKSLGPHHLDHIYKQRHESQQRNPTWPTTAATELTVDDNSRWRAVYQRLRDHINGQATLGSIDGQERTVAALNRSGPITTPPLHALNLILVDIAAEVSCPCCLETENLMAICLRSDDTTKSDGSWSGNASGDGVTFDMLLRQLGEAMYGCDDGKGPLIGKRGDRIRLDGFDWMMSGGGLHTNEIYAYIEGCSRWK